MNRDRMSKDGANTGDLGSLPSAKDVIAQQRRLSEARLRASRRVLPG
jgi:hypothetical protein